MILKQLIASVIISIILLSNISICGAISEEKTISSAKGIVAFWKNALSNNLDMVINNPEMHYWQVNRIALVNQSFDFDIIKTDSTVTPFQLIICLSFNRWHNGLSPKANSEHEYKTRIWGFKSAEDALTNIGKSDFEEADYSYIEKISRKMTIRYVLINEAWKLEGGNDLFETYIGQHVSDMKNAHLFKNVLSVPVK